jgi:KDO2-lipid IV(A) lauroyltransferase
VTFENLSKSLPEKDKPEIHQIEKAFYRNLCDLLLEVVKSQKITITELKDRVRFKNEEVFNEFYHNRKNVMAAMGHCGNWEWVGNRLGLFIKHEGAAIYKPLKDKFFDSYMVEQRQKYGNTLLMINYKHVFRTLLSLKDRLYTVFILADQSPAISEIDYFVKFLGRKTAFYQGMDKVTRKLGYAVTYFDIQRVKRGFYEVEVKVISEDARTTEEGEITKKYVHFLEESIYNQPDNWLWSHKRWKVE